MNAKQGDVNVCNEFTEEFRAVFQTNTVNSDCIFEEEFLKLTELVSDDTSCPKIDIELCQRCIHKMKLNRARDLIMFQLNTCCMAEVIYMFTYVCFLIPWFNIVMCLKNLVMV